MVLGEAHRQFPNGAVTAILVLSQSHLSAPHLAAGPVARLPDPIVQRLRATIQSIFD